MHGSPYTSPIRACKGVHCKSPGHERGDTGRGGIVKNKEQLNLAELTSLLIGGDFASYQPLGDHRTLVPLSPGQTDT